MLLLLTVTACGGDRQAEEHLAGTFVYVIPDTDLHVDPEYEHALWDLVSNDEQSLRALRSFHESYERSKAREGAVRLVLSGSGRCTNCYPRGVKGALNEWQVERGTWSLNGDSIRMDFPGWGEDGTMATIGDDGNSLTLVGPMPTRFSRHQAGQADRVDQFARDLAEAEVQMHSPVLSVAATGATTALKALSQEAVLRRSRDPWHRNLQWGQEGEAVLRIAESWLRAGTDWPRKLMASALLSYRIGVGEDLKLLLPLLDAPDAPRIPWPRFTLIERTGYNPSLSGEPWSWAKFLAKSGD